MEEYRNFKEVHLKECSKMYPSIFNEEPWKESWTEDIAYKRLKEVYDTPNFFGITYIKDEKIIGAILGNIEHWDIGEKYILKEFFIDSKCQGNGLGRKMLGELEKRLSELSVKSIELNTLMGRSTEGFYSQNGYEVNKQMIVMEKYK
ncbi:spermidine acetyltransferase [Clostridium novyi A str. 4552]|uniref:Spermidine acetyltransferase n=1 Tax=Clostridium novyi A str. 4552 TaxID=1444289 RepID=A0A0A0I6A3_CLONO|nr:GNAT family N-acetyltransferase [Clostridium novyi]KGM95180.1 spermidine acetyltransferase [Clostridium novyi A str. 4552]